MIHPPKPHVSAALAQLRHGVTLCALIVGMCAVIQMLVFGFVHFTQVRWAEPKREAQTFSVVMPMHTPAPAAPAATTTAAAPKAEHSDVPAISRQVSQWEPSLNTASDLAVSVGVIATVLLAVQCALGVFIAGAMGIPGVDRAVSAASWALLLALSGLPWRDVMPSIPFPGVFGDYASMISMSESVDAGGGSMLRLFVVYLLAPGASLCGSCLVLYRFRTGVAQGVIVTSVSELDERLEREMASIRSRGVAAASAPRAVAALNQAIGDTPTQVLAPEAPSIQNAAPAAKKPGLFGARNGRSLLSHRRVGEADAETEDEYKGRPI